MTEYNQDYEDGEWHRCGPSFGEQVLVCLVCLITGYFLAHIISALAAGRIF
jgi:hypothetical protein